MDKNRVEGLSREAKGSIKEAIGKLTGHAATEAEGRVEKTAGKAQADAGAGVDTVGETKGNVTAGK